MGKRQLIFWFLGLIFILTLVYLNHFDNSFHFDDSHTVVNNIFIRSLSNTGRFFTDPFTFSSLPSNTSYRPIVTFSLAFDYWLGNGYEHFYFHLSTFLLYLVQLGLMFFLFLRVFQNTIEIAKAQILSAISVTIFAFLTANAETINYVIARSDLYSALFVVAGMVMFTESAFCRKFGIYLLPVFIGVLSKPPAVIFLPILFVYVFLFEQDASLGNIHKGEFWMKVWNTLWECRLAIVGITFMAVFVKSMDPPTFVSGAKDACMYRLTQPYIILLYFKTYFLPLDLTADTDILAAATWSDPRIFVGFSFLAGLLLTIWFFSLEKNGRPVSFGLLWFLLALFPTSWIPLAEVMNDHRVFFPYVGLTISVVGLGNLLINTLYREGFKWIRPVAFFTVLIFVGFQGYGVYRRNQIWDNDRTLWYDVTLKSPENGRGLMNYGVCLMEEGQYEEADRYFMAAYKLIPQYSYLHTNMAIIKNALGKTQEAEQFFISGLELGRKIPSSYTFYADWLVKQKRLNEAADLLESVFVISPASPEVKHKLMDVYLKLGKTAKLSHLVKQTILINPEDPIAQRYQSILTNIIPELESSDAYVNLSLSYYEAGNYQMCIQACEKALLLNSQNADAYNNICSAYTQLGEFSLAVNACKNALRIKPEWELAINNMVLAKNNLEK